MKVKTKRTLAILLTVVLIMSGICQTVLADTGTASIGNEDFSRFLTDFSFGRLEGQTVTPYDSVNPVKDGDTVSIQFQTVRRLRRGINLLCQSCRGELRSEIHRQWL